MRKIVQIAAVVQLSAIFAVKVFLLAVFVIFKVVLVALTSGRLVLGAAPRHFGVIVSLMEARNGTAVSLSLVELLFHVVTLALNCKSIRIVQLARF